MHPATGVGASVSDGGPALALASPEGQGVTGTRLSLQ